MKSYVLLLVLLIGVVAGVAIALYGPDYMEPFLPGAAKSADGGITGVVTEKLLEKERLLITLKAPEGAILITFKKKVPEINLLVEKGDTVRLRMKGYKPFMNDPAINMVKKPEHMEEEPARKAEEPARAEEGPAREEETPQPETPETERPLTEEKAMPVTNSSL